MRPLTMVVAGVAGAKDDGVQHKCQTTRPGAYQRAGKMGGNVKEILPVRPGCRGFALSLPTAAITFVKGCLWFALLRALAPWWEITDVTEGNGKELPF